MEKEWGTDPDHGEIGPVLSGHEAELALILGLGFLIWVEGKGSLHAQRFLARSLHPYGAPLAVRGWI